MTYTNVLNRKLEEVYGVGKEFDTVAQLWGQFNNIVRDKNVSDRLPLSLPLTTERAPPRRWRARDRQRTPEQTIMAALYNVFLLPRVSIPMLLTTCPPNAPHNSSSSSSSSQSMPMLRSAPSPSCAYGRGTAPLFARC